MGITPLKRFPLTSCTKWHLIILRHFLGYRATGRLKFGIILKIGTIQLQKIWKNKQTNKQSKTYDEAIFVLFCFLFFLVFIDTEPWRYACFKRVLAYLEIILEVGISRERI